METSLHGAQMMANAEALSTTQTEGEEAEQHIHMPGPSWWPLVLGVAVLLDIFTLMSLPDSLLVGVLAVPLTLVGILGWALEDPMKKEGHIVVGQAPSLTVSDKELLAQARAAVHRTITISSTAYSAHPVHVESEGNGVLSLYGKVELEAQRRELEEAVRQIPGVRAVNNFIVAEDAILNQAMARLESLQAKKKLEGATNLSILVENYILNLYGQVPTKEMKYMLEKEMLTIPGVRVVVNHIGLNKDIPGNLGHTLNKIGGV
ncbi:MAG: BON domain-containing protein [Ktedonobacteraceae bacterium]|nr:BON domain-containing protein [Ktedonobacteraceae bacterium]